MIEVPSYEVRTSKRYHQLWNMLCEKHGYNNYNSMSSNKTNWKDIPKDEFEVMFKYPPIDVIYIPQSKLNPKTPKYTHKKNYFRMQ